ncbi:uncharacterized protein LOC133181152 [Saccostrea echinata]|uniref:uncharacterized protein LOC133181152 n=1 Tax=Saccostrea echinata TaxID=191078 RepID=UPI002A835FC9|nr:uncharacterized protein LOC133181152 [Saccostrea echinata]
MNSNGAKPSLIRQLRLFLDTDGCIHCRGRICYAKIDNETKNPYLLPKKDTVTHLIIRDAHQRSGHSELPPLPYFRTEESTPFTTTGVDFTGALFVKERSRRQSRAYICLFTCANTRAIHLETVNDLSEQSFLRAFRRFASRRSVPKIIISDNAPTFKSAANYLQQLFESKTIKEELANMGVNWKFFPKAAPWYGGFWERLIGITKSTLKKIIGRSYIDLETLQTVVTEVEAIVNDRPLTYVSSNLEDPEPLTLSHLLYGRRLTSFQYPTEDPENSNDCHSLTCRRLNQRLDNQNTILNHFWSRWKREYLTSLREYHTSNGRRSQNIKVGDIVQIHEEKPRIMWKLAVVEELIQGRDGFVRAVTLRTKNGLTNRPILKLYPIEVNENELQIQSSDRVSKTKAKERISEWTS